MQITHYSYPVLMKLNFLDSFSKIIPILTFMKIHEKGA